MANEIRHLPKIENNNINSNYNNSQKTKKCPYCKNTMDKNEKVCSTCGKKYPSKLSTAITTILLVFIIFEFGSCVSSCSSSDSDTVQDNQDTLVTSTIIAGTDNDNPLMNCDVIVIDILNGSMDNVIGQRAEVHISKDDLLSITENEFIEFTENVVVPSGYNWFTIICDDGTGIVFVGSDTYDISYGTLDSEGRINSLIQDIEFETLTNVER